MAAGVGYVTARHDYVMLVVKYARPRLGCTCYNWKSGSNRLGS